MVPMPVQLQCMEVPSPHLVQRQANAVSPLELELSPSLHAPKISGNDGGTGNYRECREKDRDERSGTIFGNFFRDVFFGYIYSFVGDISCEICKEDTRFLYMIFRFVFQIVSTNVLKRL